MASSTSLRRPCALNPSGRQSSSPRWFTPATWSSPSRGRKFDATSLPVLAGTNLDELAQFKHVERPKDWNLPALKALFELLGLAPGMAQQVAQGEEGVVQQLQKGVSAAVERLVVLQQSLQSGLLFWGRNLLTEEEAGKFRDRMDSTKAFLESLQAYTSPGKLKNFQYDAQEVDSHREGLKALEEVESLQKLTVELGPLAAYLATAGAVLSEGHEWSGRMNTAHTRFCSRCPNPAKPRKSAFRSQAQRKLNDLKKAFLRDYLKLHTRARLGVNEGQAQDQPDER